MNTKKLVALLLIPCLVSLSLCACSSSGKSDSEKIIGTWQHTDSSWGLMEYIFYSDGFCKGAYIGEWKPDYGYYSKVGGVNPSLYPDSYYEGSGDGYWSFVDNMLKIEYIGEEQGTQYYKYHFQGDELIIDGEATYSYQQGGPATWKKIN